MFGDMAYVSGSDDLGKPHDHPAALRVHLQQHVGEGRHERLLSLPVTHHVDVVAAGRQYLYDFAEGRAVLRGDVHVHDLVVVVGPRRRRFDLIERNGEMRSTQ